MRWRIHWTMRWVTDQTPGFEHVCLLSPTGNGQWLQFQWGFDGITTGPIGSVMAARLMNHATQVLEYDVRQRAPASVLASLLPNTCMTMARQVLGLPARWNIFASGLVLRSELLARGARVVLPAQGRVQ